MKIAIGCDHGALELKNTVKAHLEKRGFAVDDFGTYTAQSCDYPDFAAAAARAVASGDCDRGIVLCTTGIGVSMAANKVGGIRCALCTDSFQAEMTRRHNNANVIALGAGVTGPNLAKRMVEIFLNTEFEGGRHARRVGLVDAIKP